MANWIEQNITDITTLADSIPSHRDYFIGFFERLRKKPTAHVYVPKKMHEVRCKILSVMIRYADVGILQRFYEKNERVYHLVSRDTAVMDLFLNEHNRDAIAAYLISVQFFAVIYPTSTWDIKIITFVLKNKFPIALQWDWVIKHMFAQHYTIAKLSYENNELRLRPPMTAAEIEQFNAENAVENTANQAESPQESDELPLEEPKAKPMKRRKTQPVKK